MSQFSEEMADIAQELITEFRTQIVITRQVGGDVDPVTGAVTSPTTQNQTVDAIPLPASKGTVEAFDQRFVGGTLIETNLRALKIAGQNLQWPPEPLQTVTLEGAAWEVIGVTKSTLDNDNLVYSLTIRR
ncbi:hypothetical protein [Pseudohongiella sp. O18]|uniref:hypothetical protein n=1 Tax=Pseudohongiella sp. O18 TaxID=2904248 RepID=UPI001F27F62F|nr:hypothetical protein [Pseudohongiella sp. O18]